MTAHTQRRPGFTGSVSAPPGRTRGVLAILSAEILWGVLPLYFVLLTPTGPFELVAWRIALAFAFCALLLTVRRTWGKVIDVVRHPRMRAFTIIAGVLISLNWQTYVIATLTGQVVEASLGYFISPLMTVLLGVSVLHERLGILPWIAIGTAVVAVAVIVAGYGRIPWLALTLAATFALYGLVKKKVGPAVDAVSGLTLESLWLLPVAVVQLIVVAVTSGLTLGHAGLPHIVLLLLAGAITAIPLLLFAAGARRVPLTVIGLLQFVTPLLQFVIGVWALGEPMTTERWIGFALVWAALVLLTLDSALTAKKGRPDATAHR